MGAEVVEYNGAKEYAGWSAFEYGSLILASNVRNAQPLNIVLFLSRSQRVNLIKTNQISITGPKGNAQNENVHYCPKRTKKSESGHPQMVDGGIPTHFHCHSNRIDRQLE